MNINEIVRKIMEEATAYPDTKENSVEIRKILKKEFPKSKFKVTSTRGVVSIDWTNGVPESMVLHQLEKAKPGEGRENLLSGWSHSINTSRHISDKTRKDINDMLKSSVQWKPNSSFDEEDREKIRNRIYKSTDFSKKITVFGKVEGSFIGNLANDATFIKLHKKHLVGFQGRM